MKKLFYTVLSLVLVLCMSASALAASAEDGTFGEAAAELFAGDTSDVDLVEEPEEEEPADGADESSSSNAETESLSIAEEEIVSDIKKEDMDSYNQSISDGRNIDPNAISSDVSMDELIETDELSTASTSTRTTINLSDNYQNLNKTISAESTVRSYYNYKTNTGEIHFKSLKTTKGSIYLTIELWKKNGLFRSQAKSATLSSGKSASLSFSGLDSNTTYYFKYKNGSQISATITGKATD